MPNFNGLPIDLYKSPRFEDSALLPYQISRGCTSRCSFCDYISLAPKIEFKSYDKVLSELSQMKERYKSKTFYFCDDVINNSYEYLEGLCDLFIKNRLDIHWIVFAKVGNLDKHILRKMKEAGCRWLSFGIESGSDNILRRMNKGFTVEQASKTLKDVYELGLQSSICLIAGYPHETQEDIRQTIGFIRKNKKYIYDVLIYEFCLVCKASIYYNPEKYGVTNLTPIITRFRFAFDESGGLKWEQKQKQQVDSQRQIIKAIHKNVRRNCKLKIFLLCYFALIRHIVIKLKERVI